MAPQEPNAECNILKICGNVLVVPGNCFSLTNDRPYINWSRTRKHRFVKVFLSHAECERDAFLNYSFMEVYYV